MQKEPQRQFLRKPLIKMIVAILLAFICIILGIYRISNWPEYEFSPKAWKEVERGERYLYCNDLIKKDILNGLSLKQVNEILGKPDYESPDGSYRAYFLKSDIIIPGASYLRIWFIDNKYEKVACKYSIGGE